MHFYFPLPTERNTIPLHRLTNKNVITMQTKKIYNLVILDASTSMHNIYNETLSGVNETIDTIRIAQEKYPEMQQVLTLASFSSGDNYLKRIHTNAPIGDVRSINKEDYPLLGCTALYDAMGELISEMRLQVGKEDGVLVTILTDGYENSSLKWSGPQVKSLVEELRGLGWTFTYIGANHDVEKVASSLGVKNSLSFEASEKGVSEMFAKDRKSRMSFFSCFCCSSGPKECTDYFEE